MDALWNEYSSQHSLYFGLDIPAEVFGHAEFRGIVAVWEHLISLCCEGFTAVFWRPPSLHDLPRLVFFLKAHINTYYKAEGGETKKTQRH